MGEEGHAWVPASQLSTCVLPPSGGGAQQPDLRAKVLEHMHCPWPGRPALVTLIPSLAGNPMSTQATPDEPRPQDGEAQR